MMLKKIHNLLKNKLNDEIKILYKSNNSIYTVNLERKIGHISDKIKRMNNGKVIKVLYIKIVTSPKPRKNEQLSSEKDKKTFKEEKKSQIKNEEKKSKNEEKKEDDDEEEKDEPFTISICDLNEELKIDSNDYIVKRNISIRHNGIIYIQLKTKKLKKHMLQKHYILNQ